MSRFARRVLSLVLIGSLILSQTSAFVPAPATSISPLKIGLLKLWRNELTSALSNLWLTVRPLVPVQTSPTLDDLRTGTPSLPDAQSGTNTAPPSGYDDPAASATAYYLSLMSTRDQDTGIAGGKPMQNIDPTAGNAVVGGVSHNLDSRNYSFTAPVLSLGGRAGLNASLALTYNRRLWVKAGDGTIAFNVERGFPAPGWRLGFGAIQGLNNSGSIGAFTSTTTSKASFLYITPDGTKRELGLNTTTGLYESYDSSWLDFNTATKVLRTPDGTKVTFGEAVTANGDYQYLPTQIKDRQGNYITVVYKSLSNNDRVIDYVLDTAGRRIDFYYESNRLREVRQDRNGTIYKYLTLNYEPVTINTSSHYPYGATQPTTISGQQVYVPTRITYPTGVNFRFYYTSYAHIWAIEKWVPGVSGQGTARSVANTFFTDHSVNGVSTPANSFSATILNEQYSIYYPWPPNYSSRIDGAENWNGGGYTTYTYANQGEQIYNDYGYHYMVAVNGPKGIVKMYTTTNVQCTSCSPPSPYWQIPHQMIWQYGSDGTFYKSTDLIWEKDAGVSWSANLRVKEAAIGDTAGNSRYTKNTYSLMDGIQLLTQVDEAKNSSEPVYRRTVTTYTSYPTQRILGLPVEVSTYEGPGTKLVARSTNSYDQSGGFTDANGLALSYLMDESAAQVIQHDNTNYTTSLTQRGNLTSVTQSAVSSSGAVTGSRVIKRSGYDTNGNVRWTTDAAGNRAQLLYTDNFLNKPSSIGNTQALVYTAADPTGMRTGKQYDYWTGNLLKSFSLKPNSSTEEQIVTTSYDFADRPWQTTQSTGAWVKTYFWDNLLYSTVLQKTDTVNSADQVGFSFSRTDGAGHTLGKGSDHPSAATGKYSGQKFVYNAQGNLSDQSNVTAMNGGWTPIDEDAGTGWLFQNYQYDGQGRVIQLTHVDSTTYNAMYAGCGCAGATVTTVDERGCKVETKTDFLGRLSTAKEIAGSDSYGNPTYLNAATYTYDVLGRLSLIEVGGGYGTYTNVKQTRTFSYDDYGRLASETTPEAGTVSYSYNANDQLATKTDARGKVTTMNYNSRNLVTSVSYNDATPGASYGYDEYGARTTMTDGQGTMTYVFDANRRLLSETRTFTDLTSKFYKLTYAYTQGGQLKQVNYNAANSQSEVIPAATPQLISTSQVAQARPSLQLKRPGGKALTSEYAPFLQYRAEDAIWRNAVRVWRLTLPTETTAPTPKKNAGPYATTSVSGYVRRPASQGNTPISNVTINFVRLQGSNPPESDTATTDASGYYSYPNLPVDSSYWVFPSKADWSFTPSDVALWIDNYDATQDFIGTLTSPTTTISGQAVNDAGQGLSGVTLTLSGGMSQTTTTNSSGTYSFTVNKEQNYTVTPSKSGYTFAPTSRSYTNVMAAQTGNFVGTQTGAPPPPPTGSGPQTFSYNVNYSYNSVGALTSVGTNLIGTDANTTTNVLSGISYNGFGAVKSLNYGNGRRLSLSYSVQRHQMLTMKVDNQNGTDAIIDKTYSYTSPYLNDNDGRIKKITDALDSNYTTTYTYDMYNRVTSASSTAFTQNYQYDIWGNLRGYGPTSTPTTIYNFTNNASGAPATNRMDSVTVPIAGTVNYSWDAAGNMTGEGTTTYQYDAAGRMVSVNSGSWGSYGFDGDGKRVKKTEGGVSVYYVESLALGKTAFEVTSNGLNRAMVAYEGRTAAVLANDGQFYWVHADHLGTGRKLTSTSGTVAYRGEFDPHGNTLLETGSIALLNRKFTGYERDASGLDYAQARMYTGSRGRFTSPDPKGAGTKTRNPETFNRYAYAGNDPVNHVDRNGETYDDWVNDMIAGYCRSHGGQWVQQGFNGVGIPIWGCISIPPVIIISGGGNDSSGDSKEEQKRKEPSAIRLSFAALPVDDRAKANFGPDKNGRTVSELNALPGFCKKGSVFRIAILFNTINVDAVFDPIIFDGKYSVRPNKSTLIPINDNLKVDEILVKTLNENGLDANGNLRASYRWDIAVTVINDVEGEVFAGFNISVRGLEQPYRGRTVSQVFTEGRLNIQCDGR